jgi:hypothetical protein
VTLAKVAAAAAAALRPLPPPGPGRRPQARRLPGPATGPAGQTVTVGLKARSPRLPGCLSGWPTSDSARPATLTRKLNFKFIMITGIIMMMTVPLALTVTRDLR